MLKYFEEHDESLCCGCRSCEQVCPKQAITLQSNNEGFLYPVLMEALCVNCGLCEKACPMMNRPRGEQIKRVYAIQHKDEKILKASSSGGAFRLLADEVIGSGGYVIGCIWNQYFQPVLHIAHSLEELPPMQGSKYLSSDTNTVYTQVKQLLEQDKKVLFTGTPCQNAGLLTYLRKPYKNLLTADFLCHGVPSQFIFDRYLDAIEEKHGIVNEIKKNEDGALCPSENKIRGITSYKFRDKEKRGWGHVSTYTWKHGEKGKKHCAVGMTDPYDYGFLNGYFNRYSCYMCPFRGENRFTDFTFCDYWGIEARHNIDAAKGVSAIVLNSDKAIDFFDKLKNNINLSETTAERVAMENPTLTQMMSEEIPTKRKTIYRDIQNSGWNAVERTQLRCKHRTLKKIWYAMPQAVTSAMKKIGGKIIGYFVFIVSLFNSGI